MKDPGAAGLAADSAIADQLRNALIIIFCFAYRRPHDFIENGLIILSIVNLDIEIYTLHSTSYSTNPFPPLPLQFLCAQTV